MSWARTSALPGKAVFPFQSSSIFFPGCSPSFCDALWLIDFQWKLGMAVSSDSCRSLKYPYVAVLLKVTDHSGQIKNKSFEMTILQFQWA
ncbi:COMM domain-containing protein 6-like [Manis pentadactyla]|uniref:COMM domain-containing protein 6-like n=1 Tax=Manis pentadactyla TaxID=143292 RepID=UPI00255C2B0C|nr:COMM domain-containing protein 6-like [Manis pentadactyla]